MDWKSLFDMQQKLDQYIIDQHGLQERDLFQEKILALFVELGELANETRCFKFWSNKQANEKSIILEEYVDNVHFIMSLGLMKGFGYEAGEAEADESKMDLTGQFNTVFQSVLEFREHTGQTEYDKLFGAFLVLGKMLGFTEADIQTAYYEKNKINFDRQNEGY